MAVTAGLIRVYLACGDWFDAGFLEADERATGFAVCPRCKRECEIVMVQRGAAEIPLEEALA